MSRSEKYDQFHLRQLRENEMQSISFSEAYHSIPPPITGNISIRLNNSERTTVLCYENEVPPFIESELERIYGNFFSTLAHLRETGRIDNASTYVSLSEGKITAIFLFTLHKREVRVLNEVIPVHQEDVRQFVSHIFAKYGSIGAVSFHAVEARIEEFPYPFQCINCLEDIVLSLPDEQEDYLNRLGKSTRKTIKGNSSKLKRDFPSFATRSYEKADADEQDIRAIIEMSKVRLLSSGKISSFDDEDIERIIRSVKVYGMTCVATIDGKICAGSISYKVGENYFMHVSAHDTYYDNYRLGMLYRYITICECIRLGGRECHFLWGRQEYKFSLLGVQRDLHDLVVYRSRIHLLLGADRALRLLFNGAKRHAILRIRSWKERTGGLSSIAARLASRFWIARPEQKT